MVDPPKKRGTSSKKVLPVPDVDHPPDVVVKTARPGKVRAVVRANLWPEDAEDLIEKARNDPILGPMMVRTAVEGQVWGRKADVTPAEAILNEVRRTEALIEWLEDRLRFYGDMDSMLLPKPGPRAPAGKAEEHEARLKGAKVRQLYSMYQLARAHQSRVAKSAEAMRLAERIVSLNEGRAKMLIEALTGVLGDLVLTADQQALAPGLIRMHITAMTTRSAPPRSPFLDAIEATSG